MNAAAVDLTIIVVNYNTAHLLGEMFAAVERAAQGLSLQVIVVDNASRDDSVALLRERHPQAELIVNEVNVGFGRANNQALPLARAPFLLLLNTDAFVSPDTLASTLAYMRAHPRCGILGVRLTGRDGAQQPSCRYFPTPLNEFLWHTGLHRLMPWVRLVDDPHWDASRPAQCDWVPGCYYLVRREVVDEVGLFDPRFFLYYEEVDHCRAAKNAGWEVVYFPHTRVVHIGGESAKSDNEITASGRQVSALQIESELLYMRKHHGVAGLVATVLLASLADALVGLKALLKTGRLAGLRAGWRHSAAMYALLRRTGGGMRPTR